MCVRWSQFLIMVSYLATSISNLCSRGLRNSSPTRGRRKTWSDRTIGFIRGRFMPCSKMCVSWKQPSSQRNIDVRGFKTTLGESIHGTCLPNPCPHLHNLGTPDADGRLCQYVFQKISRYTTSSNLKKIPLSSIRHHLRSIHNRRCVPDDHQDHEGCFEYKPGKAQGKTPIHHHALSSSSLIFHIYWTRALINHLYFPWTSTSNFPFDPPQETRSFHLPWIILNQRRTVLKLGRGP